MSKRTWYDYVRTGECESCGKRTWRQAHHVVRQQDLPPQLRYAEANRMLLGDCCHPGHSSYGVNDTRISLAKVPWAAIRFAIEVLGPNRAEDYFNRYYAP